MFKCEFLMTILLVLKKTPQSKWKKGTRVANSKNKIYDYSLDSKKPIILR